MSLPLGKRKASSTFKICMKKQPRSPGFDDFGFVCSDLAPGLEYTSYCLVSASISLPVTNRKDFILSADREEERVRAEFFHMGVPRTVLWWLGAGLASLGLASQQQMTSRRKQVQKKDSKFC